MTLSDRIIKKTRKPHKCVLCLRIIPIGLRMRYWVGIHENDFHHSYCCTTCDEITKFSPEYIYDEGYVTEMLEKGQTPEELLRYLHLIKAYSQPRSFTEWFTFLNNNRDNNTQLTYRT